MWITHIFSVKPTHLISKEFVINLQYASADKRIPNKVKTPSIKTYIIAKPVQPTLDIFPYKVLRMVNIGCSMEDITYIEH